ncbi:hypothetical protein BYT27DRAFT_7220452 [Phlegmacium glaucopus]|nr:hypothetical protein BYT27DRAFT_7220452 [Phlegmacium glaucopus]
MLRRSGETMPWQSEDYFSPNRFYCVETICAPCGAVIAWTKFAKSESPTHILNFLASVYPTCLVLCTCIINGSWEEWKKTSRFIVDSYHYKNHRVNDFLCRTWCNPAPTDGSAPNLIIPAVDKKGQPCLKRAFNTQVSSAHYALLSHKICYRKTR